jgi:serine/threonine protein kinase/WD40 repeat protein
VEEGVDEVSPFDGMPSGDLRRAEAVCTRFEQAWRLGQPCIEEFITGWQEPGRSVLLHELVLIDVACRQRKGETATAEDYARFPEFDPAWLDEKSSGEDSADPPVAPGSDDTQSTLPGMPPGKRVGDFEIIHEIARGGMGVVYKARQVSLPRFVALKMILAGAHATEAELKRFIREANAIASLQHPNIVEVHEVGEHEGNPFFALEFCAGGSLERKLAGDPLPPKQAAILLATLARAVQAAHDADVIHRDLKPANVLLTYPGPLKCNPTPQPPPRNGEGDTYKSTSPSQLPAAAGSPLSASGRRAAGEGLHFAVPKITDFGLAKRLDEDGLSITAHILGTPSYMAPEQAQGNKDVGPAADVYALGAILYECLTGRPPFKAVTAYDTIRQVLTEEPVSPRRLNAQVPRDLVTICLKCLAKRPSRRYDTAAELADDLGRWLRGEAPLARAECVLERGWRWCRRHRAVAALSASVVLLLVALTVGALLRNADLREALKGSDEARQTAEQALRRADADLWKSYLSEARAMRRTGQPGQRFKTLAAIRKALALPVPEGHSLDELRTEAIACLLLPDMEVGRKWRGCPRGVGAVAIDSAFQRYVRSDSEGTIHVYRGTDDTELFRFKPPGGGGQMGISPDGRFLYQSSGGKGWLYRLDRKREVDIPLGDTRAATFSPDSQQVAVSCADHSIRLYETESGQEIKRYPIGKPLGDLFWNPKRRLLAVRYHPWTGYGLLNLDTGAFDQRHGLPNLIFWMDWHPDGRILALSEGGQDFRILLHDTKTGRPAQPPLEGHKIDGVRIRFNHGGDRLLSTDWNSNWRLWDTRSGQLLLTQPADPYEPHFSADDGLVGVDTSGSHLRAFRFCAGQEFRALIHRTAGKPGVYGRLLVDPAGRLLAASTREGITLIDLLREEEIAHLPVPGNVPFHFDASGALLTHGSSGVLRWPAKLDARTGQSRYGPPTRSRFFRSTNLDRHGASSNGRVLGIPNPTSDCAFVLHLDENRIVKLAPHFDVRSCVVSPDGKWVATARHSHSKDSAVKVWDAHTGKHIKDLLAIPGSSMVQFSLDGKWLLALTISEPRIWSVGTWQEGSALGYSPTSGAAFSADGSLLALGDVPGVVRLVVPDSGEEIARLCAPVQTHLAPECFSPDGTRLVCVGVDTFALYIFRLDLLRQQLAQLDLDWNSPPLPKPPGGAAPAPLDVRFVGGEQ